MRGSVSREKSGNCVYAVAVLLGLLCPLAAAERATPDPVALYRELRDVSLDEKQVYHIREATLNREDLHLYLSEGTIAFTKDVDGRITGAYFEGDGQILVLPPNEGERASLGVFTRLGVLDEHFHSAYLGFNDHTPQELAPHLQLEPENGLFATEHNEVARAYITHDALRLLESFTSNLGNTEDRFLHAAMAGRLGNFSASYDSLAEDQIIVGQVAHDREEVNYNLWMSFPAMRARGMKDSDRVIDPWRGSYCVRTNLTRIDAKLLPPEQMVATAELDLTVLHGGQRLLLFELSRWLRVEQVTMGEQTLPVLQNEAIETNALAQLGNDLVTIVLPRTLRSGENLKLRFTYRGNVMEQVAPGLVFVGARGIWYPNRGMELSRFDLRLQWPSEWILAATGRRTSLKEENGEKIGTWVTDEVIPFAGFNIGQYARAAVQSDGVEVEAYAASTFEKAIATVVASMTKAAIEKNTDDPTPDAHRRAQQVAAREAETIKTYEHWFGPYPFSGLSLTQLPGNTSQGWSGLVFLSSLAFLTPTEKQFLGMNEFVQVSTGSFMADHETAHQWWGDLLSTRSYRDQWLMEALANYSALMLLERDDPARARMVLEEYRDVLASRGESKRRQADAGPVTLGLRLNSSVFPNGWVNIAYGRGTWLIHMLRMMFRDAAIASGDPDPDARFFAALRTFRTRFEHKAASTSDFQHVLEEQLPLRLRYEGRKSLDWFFESWVETSVMPELKLQQLRFTRGERATASFVVEQREGSPDLVTSVPIYAVLPDGSKLYVTRIFADGKSTRLRLTVPVNTRDLLLDPYGTILTAE
jgi:hypothetical protein